MLPSNTLHDLRHSFVSVIDAMGKYPTGLMQATKADLGAFDECVETVVRDSFGHEVTRGQYCNLDMRISKGSTFVEATLAAMEMAFPQVSNYTSFPKTFCAFR